ncbi:MAG: Spy/CpxP family protein refolding chaperone [Clostridia bacterium]
MKTKSIGMILLSAALAGSGAAALAQDTHRAHEPRAFSKPTERVEARLAYLKTALKITPAQEGQWNAYAQTVRKDAAEREQKFAEWRQKHEQAGQGAQRTEHERPSAIERLERQQKFLAEASAKLNERIAAVKPLYASLSAEQKKVADVVLVPGRHGEFGRGGEHGQRHGRPHGMA